MSFRELKDPEPTAVCLTCNTPFYAPDERGFALEDIALLSPVWRCPTCRANGRYLKLPPLAWKR